SSTVKAPPPAARGSDPRGADATTVAAAAGPGKAAGGDAPAPARAEEAAPSRPCHNGKSLAAAERAQALGDRQHGLVGEGVEDRVDHPIGRAVLFQHDHVQMRAGVVEVEGATAEDVLEARGTE